MHLIAFKPLQIEKRKEEKRQANKKNDNKEERERGKIAFNN